MSVYIACALNPSSGRYTYAHTPSRANLPEDRRLQPQHKVSGSGPLLQEGMVEHYLVNHCYGPGFSSDDFDELCWKLAGQ